MSHFWGERKKSLDNPEDFAFLVDATPRIQAEFTHAAQSDRSESEGSEVRNRDEGSFTLWPTLRSAHGGWCHHLGSQDEPLSGVGRLARREGVTTPLGSNREVRKNGTARHSRLAGNDGQ